MPATDSVPTHAWSDLPRPRPSATPRRRWAPVVVLLVAVVILELIGWREAAIAVLVASVVIGVVTSVSTAARRIFDRLFAAIGRSMGSVLTVALLGIVQAVIFTPVSLLARVLRTDPLDPLTGRRGGRSSRWVARRRDERRMPRRQYANERYRARAAAADSVVGSPRWIRGAVGGLVLLLVADAVLGSLLAWLDGDDPADDIDLSVFGFDPLEQEALRTQDGAAEIMAGLAAAGHGDPDPFVGARFADDYDFSSAVVNIVDGARASAPTMLTVPDDAVLDVWFFGGSTMYGAGQRDEATIPSWLVRSTAAEGVAIRATNYGHPAYSNWQQVQLLQHHLTGGRRPDLVVFYDGFNDLTLQTQFGVHDEPTHLFFGLDPQGGAAASGDDTVAETVRGWWADHSAVALAVDRVVDLFRDEPRIQVVDNDDRPPIETIDPIAAADAAVRIHRRGVEHVEALGRAYDFEALFFWQPYLYTRDDLTASERELVGLAGYDTGVWLPMTERVRAALEDPIIDLSDSLDDEATSVFWDFVHTNERGAELVAEAIHPHLVEALSD